MPRVSETEGKARPKSRARALVESLAQRRITPGMAPDEERSTFAFNVALPFHFLLTFPYLPLFAAFGFPLLSLAATPLCICYVLCEVASGAGYPKFARHLLLFTVTITIFVFCLLLGKGSGLEGTLFYCVAIPFVFFSVRSPRHLALAFSYPAVAFVLLFLDAYEWVTPFVLTPFQAKFFYVSITMTAVVLVLAPLFLLLSHQVETERRLKRALERSEVATRAKSQFLALAGRELRTPLQGVVSGLELALDGSKESEERESLKLALTSAGVLRNVIGDLLDFSKLEEGALALSPRPIQLVEECRRVLAPLGKAAQEKGIEFRFEAEGPGSEVVLDPERLVQVLHHLADGAIRRTARGKVEVVVDQAPLDQGRAAIEIFVADTGEGLDEEERAAAFAPFGRTANGEGSATGFGLSLIRRIVRALDGDLEIVNSKGEGTKVLLRLFAPIYRRPSLAVRRFEIATKQDSRDVLLVDDEPVNRTVTARLLERAGFTVTTASDGIEAVNLWEKHHFSRILMDCQMPNMDGYDATLRIRELERGAESDRTLIVAYAESTLDEEREHCFAVGMDRFLAKPATRTELVGSLSNRLSFEG